MGWFTKKKVVKTTPKYTYQSANSISKYGVDKAMAQPGEYRVTQSSKKYADEIEKLFKSRPKGKKIWEGTGTLIPRQDGKGLLITVQGVEVGYLGEAALKTHEPVKRQFEKNPSGFRLVIDGDSFGLALKLFCPN